MKVNEGVRVLFMPHSPGIYIALVLKNADEIDYDSTLTEIEINKSMNSNNKSSKSPV